MLFCFFIIIVLFIMSQYQYLNMLTKKLNQPAKVFLEIQNIESFSESPDA